MNNRSDWFRTTFGDPIGNMEVTKYIYFCSKQTYKIETLSLPLYESKNDEKILRIYGDAGGWIWLSDVDKIDSVALKSPIYLTKRNDEAVFEHWRQLIIRNKNDYLEKIKRLDRYLESLES